MIVSMTGYGQGTVSKNNITVLVEMKAVNQRFCDISIKTPKIFMFFEEKIKKIIKGYVKRGKVDIFVTIQGSGAVNRSLLVDWNLLDQYVQFFQQANKTYRTNEQLSLNQIIHKPDIFTIVEDADHMMDLETMVESATHLASQELMQMRKAEGEILLAEFAQRLTRMEAHMQTLKQIAAKAVQTYRDRLLKKIRESNLEQVTLDESRLLTEVVIYADKSDINEELERLQSHFSQFRASLTGADQVGRKLDFIVQEMNRETNTIGSKSTEIQISQLVVELKSDLEKLKEQAQNIE